MDETTIISSKDLANLIDQCKSDIRNGGRARLCVVSVMDAMAECRGSPYIHVFPLAILSFSTELVKARELTDISMPDRIRKSHTKLLESASEQGIKSLTILKKQPCENPKIDYEELINCRAILSAGQYTIQWNKTVRTIRRGISARS
ncbi:MAG: hypothetical protein EB828_06555 [Nitrosopumilus sp. D6]|nr:MAG: hypothetical protein EB828_06555 [Nitrosopumilus sp. D6]